MPSAVTTQTKSKAKVKFPTTIIKDNVLMYSFDSVLSSVASYNNDSSLVLAMNDDDHHSGIVYLTPMSRDLKIFQSMDSELARGLVFNVSSKLAIPGGGDIVTMKYSVNYTVVLTLSDEIYVIDRTSSIALAAETSPPPPQPFKLDIHGHLNGRKKKQNIVCFDLNEDYLCVLFQNNDIQVWNLSDKQIITNFSSGYHTLELIKFHNQDPKQIISLNRNNVIEVLQWDEEHDKATEVKDMYKLSNKDRIVDLVASAETMITAIEQVTNSVYIPGSFNCSKYAHYSRLSHIVTLSDGRTITLPSTIKDYHITCGEINDQFISLISGTKLFIVKI